MSNGIPGTGTPVFSFVVALALAWAAGPSRHVAGVRQSGESTGTCSVTISGPDHICTDSEATFKAKGTPGNGSCTWEVLEPLGVGVTVQGQPDCTAIVTVPAATAPGPFKLKVTYLVKGRTCTDTFTGTIQDLIVIPVCVRLLKSSDGSKGTERTAAQVVAAFAKANEIWKQCCIRWEIEKDGMGNLKIGEVRTPPADDRLAESLQVNPLPGGGSVSEGFQKVNQIGRHKKCVNVMFVKALSGQGFTIAPFYPARPQPPTGLGNAGSGVDDKANDNTLAHELGHQLGLSHANLGKNLMSRGASGSDLSEGPGSQCEFARESARLLLQSLAAE
jgi:hypothetical protein